MSWVARPTGSLCRVVGKAAQARPLLASTHFDALLIDLEMPDRDDQALASEIRQGGGLNPALMLILISAAENLLLARSCPSPASCKSVSIELARDDRRCDRDRCIEPSRQVWRCDGHSVSFRLRKLRARTARILRHM